MRVRIDKTFQKDVRKISDAGLNQKVRHIIQHVQNAQNVGQIKNLKKIKGESDNYRIRIGDYRLGIIIQGATVEFVRCLHRKDVYKYFPK